MPCTTMLVGKNASHDGSTIIARNEDSPSGLFNAKRMRVVLPADQPRHYRSKISHVQLDLPDDPLRYTSVPDADDAEGVWAAAGVNAADVAMTATETLTSNERVLGADPLVQLVPARGRAGEADYVPEVPGGIGEEDMVTLVLPYIRSAREGVLRLGALLERHGTYEMNGIAFSDVNEIWWLETVGGHHWIARRVPDDCYVTMPNQLGIDEFDLADALGAQKEFMCSADLEGWMAQNHLDLTLPCALADDEATEGGGRGAGAPVARVFNPRDAFGSHSDADHVYNTPRAWDMHRFLTPHEGWDDLSLARGPEADDLPWCLAPERRLTVEDVKYALSLHFQGTPYDPYGRLGTSATRGMYRPIGINRNCELAVLQLRPHAPEGARALQWMAYGSNVFNALVPLFANVDETPAYLSNTDAGQVTTESFYWSSRLIAALADAQFAANQPAVERYQLAVGSRGHALVADGDRDAKSLSRKDAARALTKANERIAAMLREETDKALAAVLFTTSEGMRNAFSRSDG
ncbi:C69 family dipeptidase [Olsenella sp. HMSC062G07]|uniref:C69 family dipeptidase n=1 Tax=Olsenella sp. HMSC062G07 TaxID=1739330 RepID=UPI0008A4FC05|nr:C69 family dipeptidase [Olsenella sp. HMSC062G07]OFK23950.1 peptidase C69 [Olsenella sp. HMSC062G07]